MEPQIMPEELLIEILLRLPVKSLARFKSVRKSWLSLISDPHFGKSHFELAFAPTQKLLLLPEYCHEILSIDLNVPSLYDDSCFAVVKPLPFPLPVGGFWLLGSCRGFILLDCFPNLHIWNPSTGVHRKIPFRGEIFTFLFGFGYDPSTDDYLVVTLKMTDRELTHTQIFSSRANTWKQLKGFQLSCEMPLEFNFRVGLHFAGAIHWLVYHSKRSVGVIVAFDLTERVFSEIALPNDIDCQHNRCGFVIFNRCRLRVIGGFLCVCVCTEVNQDIGGIWVMEEYRVQSSWTRSHIVMPPNSTLRSSNFSPICSTKDGNIVGIYGYKELTKFNDKGVVLEHRNYLDHQKKCNRFNLEYSVAIHTESLLSLPTAQLAT